MALAEETWRREASWSDTFNQLKTFHDQAFKKIAEGLRYDEEGDKNKAFESYEQGLVLLDRALALNIECPSNPDFTWEKACSMVDKMRKTRKEILSRIADTQVPVVRPIAARPDDLAMEPPPSYDEAMATSPTSNSPSTSQQPSTSASTWNPPQTYSELGDSLRDLKVETDMQSVEVIFEVQGVRMYFISPDGSVSAPSQPNILRVLQLEADALKPNEENGFTLVDGRDARLPKYFLQVGAWFYPLVPDVSPCFRSDYGAFILPDLQSSEEGAAVGLMLPAEADISLYNFLEDVLHGVVSHPPAAPPKTRARSDFSATLSKGIVTGAHYVSTGLIKGAEKASQYMSSTTPKLLSHITPEENPRPVPPTLRTGAKVARSVTHTAVNVTGYVGDDTNEVEEALVDESELESEKSESVSTDERGKKHSRRHHRHMLKLSKDLHKKMQLKREKNEENGERRVGSWHSLDRPRVRRGKRHASATFVVRECDDTEVGEEALVDESELVESEKSESVSTDERGNKHSRRHHRHMLKLSKDLHKKMQLKREKNEENGSSWHSLDRPRVRRGKRHASATFVVRETGKVGSATMALGRYLAPHVQRGGTQLLAKAGVTEQTASDSVGGVLTVAVGAVEGFGTIYAGLEQSAGLLGTSLTNNTVQIVHHKYGEPLAEVTGDTLYTVGNILNTTNNLQNLTPNGLAKKTAKITGKALVEGHSVTKDKAPNLPSTSKQ